MRITNMMMQNNMMLNVKKNAGKTNDIYGQIATGKKISLPSQDPIIASRSLRFRASISATEQYIRNNDQAISWTTTTSNAFNNVNSQLKNISAALTKGATDSMSLSERKDIATSLRAYLEEIQAQMNTTYAGRYVFSGYRTDEPAILTENLNESYNINQELSYDDIISTKSYWKKDEETMAEMEDATMIRLPYTFCKNIALTNPDGTASGFAVTPKSIATGNPYTTVGDNEAVYVEETGELLLGKNVQAALLKGELNINYDKENFLKNEPNPKTYFECTKIIAPIGTATPTTLAKDPVSGILFGGAGTREEKLDQNGNPVVAQIDTDGDGTIDTTASVYVSYSMEDQDLMSYELSYKTRIKINSLGKDCLTDNLYSDLNRSIIKVLGMEISSESALKLKFQKQGLTDEALQEAIDEQISKETTQLQAIIQDEFGSMLDKIQEHANNVSRENTDLGSRQVRLDVIQVRLEEEYLNLQTLNSNNEDIDYEEAITNLTMVQSVYDASLKLTAKISQMSVLNYL